MIISKKLHKLIADQEGWTRRMFEEGIKIKKQYGEDNVYDFSLGNPDIEPPKDLQKTLAETLLHPRKGMHRYMTNSGYEEVRSEIAEYLRELYGLPFNPSQVFMTTGCAGGLNILLKSMLNRGDEVIVPSPFFWEFKNYIENYGGIMKLVMSKEDFQLDIDRIERAITKKTKVVLLNSPNNPTGAVYNEKGLKDLAGLLRQKRKEGQEIYIVADDAYRKIVYNGAKLPNLFKLYDLVMAVTSHSKDLALPGERIGYIAISPRIKGYELMVSALMISMRALGFVNAPALFQRAVGKFQRTSVSIDDYQKKRDTLYEILMEAGFECVKPMGAFYMFPKSPVPDELEFVRTLQQEERIMVVPGRGFGKKGYFRIAYCVPLATILKSRDGFIRIGKKFIKR
ncbi:MAG: pyridoxal phosphate-dependent aminotransferase [Syntrophorhabdaceae bacterium]|nr:pyridoxal phosphate-dependent aminotransferase [Syntrophorhabdaceae bacterium]MDD5243791.1 pyridoxal phosphate-dependent aminotransferase [Syntrophorhabdaceae bacterium]